MFEQTLYGLSHRFVTLTNAGWVKEQRDVPANMPLRDRARRCTPLPDLLLDETMIEACFIESSFGQSTL